MDLAVSLMNFIVPLYFVASSPTTVEDIDRGRNLKISPDSSVVLLEPQSGATPVCLNIISWTKGTFKNYNSSDFDATAIRRFSANGKWLIYSNKSKTLLINTESGVCKPILGNIDKNIIISSIIPCNNGEVFLIDSFPEQNRCFLSNQRGEVIVDFKNPQGSDSVPMRLEGLSSDETQVITYNDKCIYIYNLKTGNLLCTLPKPAGQIVSLASDGKELFYKTDLLFTYWDDFLIEQDPKICWKSNYQKAIIAAVLQPDKKGPVVFFQIKEEGNPHYTYYLDIKNIQGDYTRKKIDHDPNLPIEKAVLTKEGDLLIVSGNTVTLFTGKGGMGRVNHTRKVCDAAISADRKIIVIKDDGGELCKCVLNYVETEVSKEDIEQPTPHKTSFDPNAASGPCSLM